MNGANWMNVALQKANDSLKAGEVPVGCLFVYNNKVIATGNNTVNETHNATRHAEINCIDQVLEFCKEKNLNYKRVFYDIDVIVTVEPCIMCTSALYQLQVRNIIYGCANDRFGGCTSVFEVPKLYNSGTTIVGGIKGDEAMTLLKEFYKGTNPNAPVSKMKKKL
ncbi:tRNA-specific adenosine deaminase 2 [Habropoda laboriosa]|uniref:tRNA-specific adenosine deaminase 2 n=1 Tax=Habropoda laboriosa TaxID=597456 RepID=A0A0L7QMC3_9HYME|nr:PREDICTED: tRNA-specific adenosine deaminase 2 [Habropoda laboriosa]KOC59699.1 tRNA-specific adenosine deaminase 2 [Habropoda laboriosa]